MKTAIVSLVVLSASGAGVLALMDHEEAVVAPVQEQQDVEQNTDADHLYNLVRQARAELREMRVSGGLSPYSAGPQAGQRKGDEGGDEHAGRQGASQGDEHGGPEGGSQGDRHIGRERGERGEGGEEGGSYLAKMTKQNELFANGARLVLQFNPNTQVFVGSVTNTTAKTLSQVRVEIHLDNGRELGPTKRIDVGPGQTIPVELGTFGNEFSSWVSHAEAGVEQGHGAGGEEGGEGRGEHGAGGEESGEGVRPGDLAYRPLYNQLQILRGEMHAFEVELKLGGATR